MKSHHGAPRGLVRLLAALLLAVLPAAIVDAAYTLDVNSTKSVKDVAKDLAADMMTYYHGDEPGNIPGVLPEPPYYWWLGGALMGSLIEYWYYTKDDTYVKLVQQGLLFQIGDNEDYMPKNQTLTEGNDDQGFWGLAVMAAAEYNFPHPGEDSGPSWLALAQAVFNTQAPRWDTTHCNGGLRWQIYNWNKGWDYKNSISQGTFFALAARLALYTGNQTYADWAVKTWDWMIDIKFIDEYWYVYDGAHTPNNCTEIVPWQFTYNAGCFIVGSAAMYNFTEDKEWKERLDNLLGGAKVFFRGPDRNIMEEVACESVDRCNSDQQSFKAYLSRWLAAVTQWVPDTYDTILPWLQASAIAATDQCKGGKNGRMCGLKWSTEKYDGTTGVGQQMAALEVTLACMVKQRDPILTDSTGGTSKGDPSAGSGDIGRETPEIVWAPITKGQKAGAAILTAVVLGLLLLGIFWLIHDENSDKGLADQVKGSTLFVGAAAGPIIGAAAVMRRKDTRDMSEKTAAGQALSTSPEDSSVERVNATVATRASRGESMSGRSSRRLSNMPRGWPDNPVLRSSVIAEPGSEQRFSRVSLSVHQRSSSSQIPEEGNSGPASVSGNETATLATPTPPPNVRLVDDEIRPAPPRT